MIKINKAYKYRLYPNQEQVLQLKQIAGNNRFIWNSFLSFTNGHKELYGKYLYRNDLSSYILYLKEEYPFLKLSYSQSLQYQAYSLDKSINNIYRKDIVAGRKKAISKAMTELNEEWKKNKLAKAYNYGFPKYKKKSNYNDTICYPQFFEINKNTIKLPKLGLVKYKQHRQFEGVPKNITISQDGNNWYISILCEIEIEEQKIKTDNIIGIDLGLKEFAVFSNGEIISNPKIYRKEENKVKRESKRLSRREEGSNRRKSSQLKVHKVHGRIRNKRKDFLHKLTHYMITKYDGFVLEDLSSKNMMKNHKLAKSISDVSWSEFLRILEYKCLWNFKYFEKIDRFAPSSQICSKCGNKQDMPLEIRIYNCNACENIIDRDYNASINILNLSTLGTNGIYGQGEDTIVVSGTVKKNSRNIF